MRPVTSRVYEPGAVEELTTNVKAWHFPRIEIWPMNGESRATPSEFSPFMDADPVAEEATASDTRVTDRPHRIPKTDAPRMVLWMRPAYTADWAITEREGTVRLGFTISSSGGVSDIQVEESSGSARLDDAAVSAIRYWKFSPAKWNATPTESKATVAMTFKF